MATLRDRYVQCIKEMQNHLFNELVPFWLTHGVDKEYGGYLTYLDRNGNPTGEGVKTLICQTRMIYSNSSAHRNNLGDGKFLDIARQGVEFLFKHFWDDEFTGWYWTTEQDGTPKNLSKLMYGQSFAIYSLSEYAMASGDPRALEMAEETYKCITSLAHDNSYGGFFEFM
ncbi:MAG: AGE family epimerase/isomerase [Candidatus Hydrogenedentes bacterium]|nr:AGE family epimerase/isomerase [Candidatus Hydrogenedentota bacterium]